MVFLFLCLPPSNYLLRQGAASNQYNIIQFERFHDVLVLQLYE